nr:hypothetical protein B296_00042804 [Ipomoea trifida]
MAKEIEKLKKICEKVNRNEAKIVVLWEEPATMKNANIAMASTLEGMAKIIKEIRTTQKDPVVEDANIDNEQSGDNPKKEQSRKVYTFHPLLIYTKEGSDIDFTKAFGTDLLHIFYPPKDCHYQPENLVKLFLLPNVMVSLLLKDSFIKYFPYQDQPFMKTEACDSEAGSEQGFEHTTVLARLEPKLVQVQKT